MVLVSYRQIVSLTDEHHQRLELKFQSSLRIQFDEPLFLASTHFPSSGYMYWPQLADAAAIHLS